MKRKFLVSTLAGAALFMTTAAFAANPTVVVNDRTIAFEDQPAIISEEGRTLVPARGVFENMGADVEWFESDRSISVTSGDIKVVLKIDDSTMKVRTFTNLLDYTEEIITLDTAPQIINDRTMIPLRAVSEAFDCDVQWDEASYTVTINTKKEEVQENVSAEQAEDTRVKMSISADKEDVNAGDEVNIYVNVDNLSDENLLLTTTTSRIFYDSTKFEFVKSELVMQDTTKQVLGGSNVIAENSSVKTAFVIVDSTEQLKNGTLYACTFKALTDEGGEFVLSDEVSTTRGNDTMVAAVDEKGDTVAYKDSNTLAIDLTPVVVK